MNRASGGPGSLWLVPFEPLYGAAVRLRGALYDAGWRAARRAAVPVVSVGNITAGGSGKSPMAAWCAARLQEAGRRPAVVSRGYGGSHQGPATVVSDGKGPLVGADVAGDEPVMLARQLPGIPVIVSRRRIDGATMAAERFGSRCVVLDDGFQHRALARSLDIVMVDGVEPFGTGHLLPAGALREPLAGLRRASVIVIHGPDAAEPPAAGAIREAAAGHCPSAPVLRSWVTPASLVEAGSGASVPLESLVGMKVVCMAAIARPGRFFETVRRCGAQVAREMSWMDHHRFSRQDLERVARAAGDSGAAAVVTTEKDLARLGERSPESLPVLLALRMEMHVREQDPLIRLLEDATA